MKLTPSLPLGLAAAVLVASTLFTASPVASSGPQQSAAAADDPVAPLFAQTCNRCHDGARITATRRTRAEWEEVLTKMIEKGATGSEKDFESIYDYVVRHFGRVYINTATADEITAVLSLSKKDAEAIVAFRKTNGTFADVDALKKVPEIDIKKIDDHRDALMF